MKGVEPLHRKFWSAFDEAARRESELVRSGALELVDHPPRMHRGLRLGFKNAVKIELLINVHDYASSKGTSGGVPPHSIAIDLRIDQALAGREPDEVVALLRQDQQSIHADVGSPLEWPALDPDKPQKRQVILLVNHGSDPADERNWPTQRQWFLEKLERFHTAFVPRLESIRNH